MSAPQTGSIVFGSIGNANAQVFPLPEHPTLASLEISGAYTGAQLVFEAQPLGVATWYPVAGVQQDTQAVVNGYAATPLLIVPDGATLCWKFDVSLCGSIRVWCAALTGGTLNVIWNSGSFFFNSPGGSGAAGGVSLAAATLWQLMELTRVCAAGLGQTATPNPVLPGGLPASIWNNF
jgi:hypothetical protein